MVQNGAVRIFRLAGVDVYIHWSWLVILYILGSGMGKEFTSPVWIVVDVGSYVGMVFLHEVVQLITGRMVGGVVTQMFITFFGRSSNLELPQRPWPIIITYSAGILAYAFMLAGTIAFYIAARSGFGGHDAWLLGLFMLYFNIILLAWAAVPVYPLDGGKVLQAFLWLFMSRKRSLQTACIIGIPISLGMIAFSFWLAVIGMSYFWIIWSLLTFMQCIQGFRLAKAFDFLEKIPRRTDVACPHCKQHPFNLTSMRCPCGQDLDPFQTRGLCPECGSSTAIMPCPLCGQRSPIHQWFGSSGGFEVQSPNIVVQASTPQSVLLAQPPGDSPKPP